MTEFEIFILPDATISFATQFTLASTVYFILSMLSPAHETMLDHAILDQETLADDGHIFGSDEKKEVDNYRVDETVVV